MGLTKFSQTPDSSNQSSSSAFGTFGGFKGFGTLGGFGKTDLNDTEALLALAQQEGGALGQVADELAHPTRSILSTIGDGFKKAFGTFVDVISLPSEIVAGAISSKYTIGEAINQNIKPSDVIFGDHDPEASTMKKVGSFLVRTASDILLDPLTYVTFGAAQGIAGLSGATKVTAGETLAAAIGKEAGTAVALSKEGTSVFKYLKAIENQANGLTKMLGIKAGDSEAFELGAAELNKLLANTIDSPLKPDLAKKALSSILEKNPALAETLLDKGGIKFFGKSMVSGQRIQAVKELIPGMTALDNLTAPARNAVQALFDPALVKVNGNYVRLPEEYVEFELATRNLSSSLKDERIKRLTDIVKGNKLTSDEAKTLFANVEARSIPADARLANAYNQLLGFNENEFKFLKDMGIPITFLDKHAPHVLLKEDIGHIAMNMPPKSSVGAAMERQISKFVNAESGEVLGIGSAEKLGLTKEIASEADVKTLEDAVTLFKDKGGNAYKRVAASIEEIKAAGFDGFDDNIITAHAQRTMDNVVAGTSRGFMRGVVENFGKPASEAAQGWRPINVKGISEQAEKALQVLGKDGEQMVFHPAIAKRIETFLGSVINDEATNDFLKAYDSIQNLWKASVTSIFPAFHGRNGISNVFQNFLDLGLHAINPATHGMSSSLVMADRRLAKLETIAAGIGEEAVKAQDQIAEMMGRKVFTDVTGYEWTLGELRTTMRRQGIAFGSSIVGPSDIQAGQKGLQAVLFGEETAGKKVAKAVLPTSQDFLPFQAGQAVGKAVEEQARVLNFITNLRKTGDVGMAVQRTKQFLFDYQNLTKFEKTVLRRVIPFYTFTRKNIELQARALMSTPGRIATEITGLTNLGDAFAGGQLSEEDKAKLPDWIKAGISILAKKNGNDINVIGSLGTPIEQPFSALQPNQFFGGISPILRVPFEQLTGYNIYSGKFLSDMTDATAYKHAPKVVQDFIGYTEVKTTDQKGKKNTLYVALRPERMNLMNNLPPTTRVLTSLRQLENENVTTGGKIMQQLLGVRVYSFDLEQEQAQREKELRNKLQDLLTKAKVTAKMNRVFIPKE